MCGFIGYLYHGIRVKWLYRSGRGFNSLHEDAFEIIIATLCGVYTLFWVMTHKY